MGGALALDAAWLFAAFLVILVLAAAGIAARRFLLERNGGTVECGLRKENGSWRLGLASYRREDLYWYGIFGLSMRPDEIFPRRDLALVSRRSPTEAEAASLGPGMIVVVFRFGEDASQLGSVASGSGGAFAPGDASGSRGDGGSGGSGGAGSSGGAGGSGSVGGSGSAAGVGAGRVGTVELALGEAALTGLLSWLEAAPPGSHLGAAI